ncbi:MAG: Gfo/Idh/MocA family oxidoreductase [Clostridia bacterium]|nr:Gfo/Idh/MocA family oxidoreductase [Clostridia bacterium]
MRKLRFGIIGAGGIADRRVLPAMANCKNAEITAVMEINPEHAERLRAKYNAKYAYTNEEELLKNPEIDAVYIASPVVFHAKQTKLAADYGKHVLLEKPIAMTTAEGEDVLNYCAQKGIKVAAGFMMRFGAHIMNMKKAVSEGKIGQVVSGYSQFTLWLPKEEGNWRQEKAKSGGGSLMDMGVHCIDLMEYILGTRVKAVAAFNDTVVFDYDVEDSSTVLLKMENGAQCVVQTNFNIPDEVAKWRMEFFGTKGRLMGSNIIGQNDGGTLTAIFMDNVPGYNAQQDHIDVKGVEIDGEFGNMYIREVESFADSILNDKPLVVPASDALHVQKVIAAAYLSTEKNKIIEI